MGAKNLRWSPDGVEPLLDTRRLQRPLGYATVNPVTGDRREILQVAGWEVEITDKPLLRRFLKGVEWLKNLRNAV